MIVETDDKVLMGLFQNKATRNEGFKVILTQYSQRIYFFLRRMGLNHDDADELLQNLFVKFSRTAALCDTIKITLYRLAATDCLAYLVKHRVARLPGLTSEQLLIMVLKVQEEFDFADIAQITSIPVSEVRSLFKAGINKMNNQSNIKI